VRFFERRARTGKLSAWPAAVGLIIVLVLAGCGGAKKHSSTQSSKSTSSAPSATASTTTSTTPPATPAVAPFPYVADSVNSPGVDQLRVAIYDLRRTGPFLTLDFSVTCLSAGGNCDYNSDLDGYASDENPSPDGVALVDATNNKEYLPVEDTQQQTYGSKLTGIVIGGGVPTELAWVKFAAPPASVTAVDVAFPDGGPQISNVPIVDSATPPTPAQVGPHVAAAAPAPFAIGPDSTDTTGLKLRVADLVLKVGNKAGSDQESGARSTITLSSDVLFHFDKSNLTPAATTVIAGVAAKIKARANGVVSVVGYTDSIGSDAVNLPLSRRRAASVVSALRRGASGASVQFTSAGRGSADPVAPNTKRDGSDNPAGRALNRRVTITFNASVPAPPTPPTAGSASASPTAGTGSRNVVFHVHPGRSDLDYLITAEGLYRVGDLLVLHLTDQCQASSGCDGITEFAGDETVVPPLSSLFTGSLSNTSLGKTAAIYLRDPATGDEYVAAYNHNNDTDQNPLTATVGGSSSVTLPLWAYYPAPPASVTALDVVMPAGHGTISGVPITDGPPPLPSPTPASSTSTTSTTS
jgi:outer membrane protein OmpA-like peptidoglycan-associated protein